MRDASFALQVNDLSYVKPEIGQEITIYFDSFQTSITTMTGKYFKEWRAIIYDTIGKREAESWSLGFVKEGDTAESIKASLIGEVEQYLTEYWRVFRVEAVEMIIDADYSQLGSNDYMLNNDLRTPSFPMQPLYKYDISEEDKYCSRIMWVDASERTSKLYKAINPFGLGNTLLSSGVDKDFVIKNEEGISSEAIKEYMDIMKINGGE